MKLNSIVVTIIVLISNVYFINAQRDTTKTTQIERMTIIGAIEPTLETKKKPEINPEVNSENIDFPKQEFQMEKVYSLPTFNKQNSFPFYQLPKSSRIVDETFKNYIILGFANYITPLAEFYANIQANREHAFGIHLKHLSSQGRIKDYAKNAYSHNNFDVFYNYMSSNVIFKADLFLDRDVVHYYGFKPELISDNGLLLPSDDSIKQRYLLLGGKVGLSNNPTRSSDFQYAINLGFYNFSDRNNNTENNFAAELKLKNGVNWVRLADKQAIGAYFNFDYYNEKAFAPNTTNSTQLLDVKRLSKALKFTFNPFYAIEWNEYYLKLGFDASVTSTNKGSKIHIHPDIEAKLKVAPEKFELYAGLGGKVDYNSMKDLIQNNPFIAPSMACVFEDESFMDKKITIYGGLNANIIEGWDLKAGVNYSFIDNMAFFMRNTLSGYITTYKPIFVKTNELNVYLRTNYSFIDKIRANVSVDYYNYSSGDLKYAYYKPEFKLNVSLEYRPITELKLDIGFNLYSKMWVYDGDVTLYDVTYLDKYIQLPALYDLNLGGEYKIWQELYGFINISNILNQNYEYYLNYPSQGIMIMCGAKYRF